MLEAQLLFWSLCLG